MSRKCHVLCITAKLSCASQQNWAHDFRSGSPTDFRRCPRHVCFPPDSDQIADIASHQRRATNRLMRCSKQYLYSITSSAMTSSGGKFSGPASVNPGLPMTVSDTEAVSQRSNGLDKFTQEIDCGNSVKRRSRQAVLVSAIIFHNAPLH